MVVGVVTEQSDPAVHALSNGSTVPLPTNLGIGVLVSSAGNVTGIILTAGTYDGQFLYVENTTLFSVTMAAAATSNVLSGTACVIAAGAGAVFRWEQTLGTPVWVCVARG
jgi:hypothetical protein